MRKIDRKEGISKGNFERHLFIPDLQIPDENKKAVNLMFDFIGDYKPDKVHIMGDLMNFTRISKFLVLGDSGATVKEELDASRKFLTDLEKKVRHYKPDAEINYLEGNHELRLAKYIARNADEITDVTDTDGEVLLTVPHLLGLKELGINWISYYEKHKEGDTIIEHGDIARVKAGYTAQGMIDRRGKSGFSVHTHRLAFVTRMIDGEERYWVEAGSLCNLEPTPTYMKQPDWVNGFAIGLYDKGEKIMHPATILIQKGQFVYNDRLYKEENGKGAK